MQQVWGQPGLHKTLLRRGDAGGRGQQERNHTEVLIFQKKKSTSEKCSEVYMQRWRWRSRACGKRESKGIFKNKQRWQRWKENQSYSWMLQASAKAGVEGCCPAFSTNRSLALEKSLPSLYQEPSAVVKIHTKTRNHCSWSKFAYYCGTSVISCHLVPPYQNNNLSCPKHLGCTERDTMVHAHTRRRPISSNV